jgi:hypothetical protein
MMITYGPAGREGPIGAGVDGFFREVATPVGERDVPEPTVPDAEHFARRMALYGDRPARSAAGPRRLTGTIAV